MPDDIEFKIKTTGDPSGADDVTKSLFGARTETEKMNDAADVAAVKAKQAIEIQKAQAASLLQIADAEQRVVAAGLANAIGQIANQFSGLGPEVDLCITSTKNFLNVFASTGDPIKAAMAVAVGAIEGVITAYKKAEDQAKDIAKAEQEDVRKFAELRRDLAAQIRAENLTSYFQAELSALDKQEAAMLRIYQLRQSERDLAAAQQSAAGAAAVAGGGSPEAAAAQSLAAQLQNSIASLSDSLAEANAKTEKLEADAITLKQKADALVENSPEQIDALKQANVAKEAAETSKLDLATFTSVTLNQIQSVILEAKTSGVAVTESGLEAVRDAAEKQKAALQSEVDRLGASASSGAKEALKTLSKVLEDGVIKPDELGKITEILSRVRSSREASDTAVFEGFEGLTKASEAMLQKIQPLASNIDSMLQSMEQISSGQAARDARVEDLLRYIQNVEEKSAASLSNR